MKKMSAVKKFIVMGSIILSMISSPLSAVWPLTDDSSEFLQGYLAAVHAAYEGQRASRSQRAWEYCNMLLSPFGLASPTSTLQDDINSTLSVENRKLAFDTQSITILNLLVKPLDDAYKASDNMEAKEWYAHQMIKLTQNFREILGPDRLSHPMLPDVIKFILDRTRIFDDFAMRRNHAPSWWDWINEVEIPETDSRPIRLVERLGKTSIATISSYSPDRNEDELELPTALPRRRSLGIEGLSDDDPTGV